MGENNNFEQDNKAFLADQTEAVQNEAPEVHDVFVEQESSPQKNFLAKFIIWFLAVLVFLIVLFFVFPFMMGVFARGDIDRPDLSDLELKKVDIPDFDNAFIDLAKLSGEMSGGEVKEARIKIDLPADINKIDHLESYNWEEGVVEELLEKNKDALSVFTDAANKRNFQNINTADPKNIKSTMPVVSLNNWHSASKLSVIKVFYLMKQDKEVEAFEEALKSVRIGSTIERADNITASEYLAGLSIKKNGLDALKTLVDRTTLLPVELKMVQKILAEQKTRPSGNFLKTEFIIFQKAIDRIAEGKTYEEASLLVPPANGFYLKPNQTISEKADSLRKHITHHEGACSEQAIEKKYPRPPIWKMFFTKNAIGKMSLSNDLEWSHIKQKKCEIEVELDNIVVALAVKRYLFDNGEYPEKMENLAPDYIEEIPKDSFSGQDLRFNGSDKTVYSVGSNLADDNGSVVDDIVLFLDFSVAKRDLGQEKNMELNMVDSDNDGLLDFEEAWYGTDKDDHDTDKDTFSDGDEVKGGYDPTGPGNLRAGQNTPPGMILMLEQAQFNCDKDYFEKMLIDPLDFDALSAGEKQVMGKKGMDDEELKKWFLNEFYFNKVYVNEIKNIEIIEKRFFSKNSVFINYLLHYHETAGSKPPAKNNVYIVVLNGENWEVDIGEMLKYKLQEGVDLDDQDIMDKDARRLADIKQIITANELYYIDESKYINAVIPGGSITGSNNTYLSEIPSNPAAESGVCADFGEYRYNSFEEGQRYELVYCLEKGIGSVPAGINIATSELISKRTTDNSAPVEYRTCE